MNKIKKIVLCFCVLLLLFPTIIYASEIEKIEEIEIEESISETSSVLSSVNSLGIELDNTYTNSQKDYVEVIDKLNDFFVSVCYKEALDSGFITEEDNIFISSGYSSQYVYIYKNLYYSETENVIYSLGNYYRRYKISYIFDNSFSSNVFTYKSGSAKTVIASGDIIHNVNTNPNRYYSNYLLINNETFRSIPKPLTLDESYLHYFKGSDNVTNITLLDLTETNKILNNIFVIIVFVILYLWFLSPCFKLLVGREK